MPFYDRRCTGCEWKAVDVLEPITLAISVVCPVCHEPTERAWLSAPPNVIGDECDFTSNNGEKTPIRFRSKADHKRWLREKGYVVKDSHVGEAGSDKSKFSTRWVGGGKQWMADAEELAKRNGSASGTTPTPDDHFNIEWSEGIAPADMVARYAGK